MKERHEKNDHERQKHAVRRSEGESEKGTRENYDRKKERTTTERK